MAQPEPRPEPILVISAESRVRHPRRFIREAITDLRASLPIARSLLAQRLRQRYRQSSLGFLWAIVPAAFVSVVMTIGRKARFPLMDTGPIPPQVYGLYGIVMMQSFMEALNAERMAISGNRQLLSRQRVPLEGMLLAGAGEMLVSLTMKLVAVAFVCLLLNAPPALTLPLGLVAIVLLGKWAFAVLRNYHLQAEAGEDPVFIAEEARLPGPLEGDIWTRSEAHSLR